MVRARKRANSVNRHPRQSTSPEDREDARDYAMIRREIAKGGRTYSHAQVMKELGRDDLATPIHKRS